MVHILNTNYRYHYHYLRLFTVIKSILWGVWFRWLSFNFLHHSEPHTNSNIWHQSMHSSRISNWCWLYCIHAGCWELDGIGRGCVTSLLCRRRLRLPPCRTSTQWGPSARLQDIRHRTIPSPANDCLRHICLHPENDRHVIMPCDHFTLTASVYRLLIFTELQIYSLETFFRFVINCHQLLARSSRIKNAIILSNMFYNTNMHTAKPFWHEH